MKGRQVVKAFVALNVLLACIPLCLNIAGIPDVLQVDSSFAGHVALQVGNVNAGGSVTFNRERPWDDRSPMYLPFGYDLNCLAIGFKNGPDEIDIRSIRIRKWCVWPQEIKISDFAKGYDVVGGVRSKGQGGTFRVKIDKDGGWFVPSDRGAELWRNVLLRNPLFWCGLALFEILILLVAFLASRFGLNNDGQTWKGFLAQAFCVALAVASLFCLILPVQSYLVGKDSFDFSMGGLVSELVPFWFVTLVMLVIVLVVARMAVGRLLMAILICVAIFVYLETGILSMSYPSMDGDIRFYTNPIRGVWNGAVLMGLFIFFLALYHWLKCHLHWIAIVLLLMSGLSLFDVKVKERVAASVNGVSFYDAETFLRSAVYSPKRNTLVFVLDALSTELALDIVNSDANVLNTLQGFVAYVNNVGMHNTTNRGIPGLLSGVYLDDIKNGIAYQSEIAGTNSCVWAFANLDLPAYFMVDISRNFNFSNRVNQQKVEKRKEDMSPLQYRMKGLQPWNLYEIVRFRSVPFMLKHAVYLMTIKSWPNYDRGAVEYALYPRLTELPFDDSADNTLHIYHTAGAHAPYTTGRNGEKLAQPRFDYVGAYDKGYYAMKNLCKLFEFYKEHGLYERSMIIITADHGSHFTKEQVCECNGRKMDGTTHLPCLMVKPVGAEGKFEVSDVPTCHKCISGLIARSATEVLSDNEIKMSLTARDRRFTYFFDATGIREDWFINDDGSVITCEMTQR